MLQRLLSALPTRLLSQPISSNRIYFVLNVFATSIFLQHPLLNTSRQATTLRTKNTIVDMRSSAEAWRTDIPKCVTIASLA